MYEQNSIDEWIKGCILFFSKKGDLGINKNYTCSTLISITAKVYYILLLNRIWSKIEKIRTFFEKTDAQPAKFWLYNYE